MYEEKLWAEDVVARLEKKMRAVVERSCHKIPYTTVDGIHDDLTKNHICWWTNGFWGGILWQMYQLTKEEVYKKAAIEVEEKLDKNLMIHMGMDHDSGFKWLTTSGANYRLTGDKDAYNRTLLAADNLAGRLNPAGGFIRAWNDEGDGSRAGWAIIDCMMNLPLLYWASKEIKDPRYEQIAQIHAQTVMKNFVRQDGSVYHIVEFNPSTGEFVKAHGGQGIEENSSWTRGQSWAVYGFVLSYIHTGKKEYLDTARRVADYFINNTWENGAIPVDFRQPSECTWEDSTAAAIAACGMLEIAKALGDEGLRYHEHAVKMLRFLDENRCDWGIEKDNIVEKCTAAYHDEKHEFSIIYGDYYFIEAVLKLTGRELFIW